MPQEQGHTEKEEVRIPSWTLEDLRVHTLLDALRLDALVQLLEAKGIFTHDELLGQIENSVRHRFQKVIEGLGNPGGQADPVGDIVGEVELFVSEGSAYLYCPQQEDSDRGKQKKGQRVVVIGQTVKRPLEVQKNPAPERSERLV